MGYSVQKFRTFTMSQFMTDIQNISFFFLHEKSVVGTH